MFVKNIRWLLSYLIPICILLLIATTFVYRAEITQWYSEWRMPMNKVMEFADSNSTPLLPVTSDDVDEINSSSSDTEEMNISSLDIEETQISSSDIEDTNISSPDTEETQISSPDTEEMNISSPDTEETQISSSDTEEMNISSPDTEETQISSSDTEETNISSPDTKETQISSQGTEEISVTTQNNENEQGSNKIVASVQYVVLTNQLKMARQAYWSGDLILAENHYVKLLAAYPGDANLWGELGNIQWAQGNYEAAANSYYQAAHILIKQRQFARLSQIYPIISHYAPDKVKELDSLIQAEYDDIYNS